MAQPRHRSPAGDPVARTYNVTTGASGTTKAIESDASLRLRPGPKPGSEAAKRGGTAVREKYGSDFFSRIGAKGGTTVRDRYGSAFFAAMGQRGGETTKRNLGTEHYARIGRIGGRQKQRTRAGGGETTTSRADDAFSR